MYRQLDPWLRPSASAATRMPSVGCHQLLDVCEPIREVPRARDHASCVAPRCCDRCTSRAGREGRYVEARAAFGDLLSVEAPVQ